MSAPLGSARTLLLAALAAAAVVMVGSIALMATGGGGSTSSSGAGGGGRDGDGGGLGFGPGRASGKSSRSNSSKSGDTEPNDGDEDPNRIEWRQPGGLDVDRAPHNGDDGDFVVDADSLRAVFAARHWEEIRRQIEVLQAEGKGVPADVVRDLLAMLGSKDENARTDAMLALGGVKDDATGRALAEIATSSTATLDERKAALDALSRSGQAAALAAVQRLATSEGANDGLLRKAFPALAAIGGPEATKTLLDLLKLHEQDGLRDAVLGALGKARDADGSLARAMRDAAEKGDKQSLQTVYVVAQMQGQNVGPEVKAELERVVSGGLSSMEEGEDRLVVQGTAMPAAVSAGIVEPVLRAATTSGPLHDVALQALRQARGDSAAKQIAAALARSTDEAERRELTVALGETASFAATPTLVALLDDPSVNVRNAAARGIGQVRDPAANKAVLAHLAKAKDDRDFALGLVDALGRIGMKESLPPLKKLVASEDGTWPLVRTFIQRAIARIETGNPDSMLLQSSAKKDD